MKKDLNLLRVKDTSIKVSSSKKIFTFFLILVIISAFALLGFMFFNYNSKLKTTNNSINDIQLKIKSINQSKISQSEIDKEKIEIEKINNKINGYNSSAASINGELLGLKYGVIEKLLFDPTNEKTQAKYKRNGEDFLIRDLTKKNDSEDVNKSSYLKFNSKKVNLNKDGIDISAMLTFLAPQHGKIESDRPDMIGSEDSVVNQYIKYLEIVLFEKLKEKLPSIYKNFDPDSEEVVLKFEKTKGKLLLKKGDKEILSIDNFITKLQQPGISENKEMSQNSTFNMTINKDEYAFIIAALEEAYKN